MNYATFNKYNNIYIINESSDPKIHILACFLTDDFGSGWPSFKEWASNSESKYTESNISWLEKENDNIIIGYLYDKSEDIYEYSFRISKKHFLDLLDKWEKLYKQGPKEILLTYEDGKIQLEGIN